MIFGLLAVLSLAAQSRWHPVKRRRVQCLEILTETDPALLAFNFMAGGPVLFWVSIRKVFTRE